MTVKVDLIARICILNFSNQFNYRFREKNRPKMDLKRLALSVFVTALVVLISTTETEACSCYPSHPQTSYCNSEYGEWHLTSDETWNLLSARHPSVIVARILRKSNRRINNQHIYKIDIVKTYKTTEKAQQYLKQSRLITAPNDGLCGITFSEFEK